ncbi:MAG: hypothetical protein ACOX6T_12580 [Myxococcales bacterium]|jgi:hypothetical protein
MHRIDTADSVYGLFSDGSEVTGVPGTLVDAAWLNAVQEELATAIEGLGGTLTKGTNTQLRDLLKASCQAVLTFGADMVALSALQSKYLVPGFGALLTTHCALPCPIAGVIRGFRVNAGTPSDGSVGSGDVFVVMKNGSDTAITCSLGPGETNAADVTNAVAVSAGDTIEVKVTRIGSGITSPAENVVATLALMRG